MRKNVASQYISVSLVSKTDGSAVTSGTTNVFLSKDGGAQGAGGNTTATHKGNGEWEYALTQADSNANHIAFTFVNSSAINGVINVDPTAADPTDSVRLGLTALPNAAAGANGGLPLSVDTSGRVDVLKINGTSQTARDIGASVLISSGTGTGQLDVTSGVVKANLVQILATALTETAGQIAAAFKKFFDVATPTGSVNSLPNAAAAASGGLPILGTNASAISFTAGMTISNTAGDGLTVSTSNSGSNGMTVTGNGAGNGIQATGGATGNGIKAIGGATSGSGVLATAGATTGDGITATGTAAGNGINATGGNSATTGGIKASGGAALANGIIAVGNTAGSGIAATGGNSSSTAGITAKGGASGAPGIYALGNTSGAGISATGGNAGTGILAVGTAAGHGISATGGTTAGAAGINAAGGATNATNGMKIAGGSSSGAGLLISATSGDAVTATGGTNGSGMNLTGAGTGSGMLLTKGASGHDMTFATPDVTITNVTNLTNAPTAGDFNSTMKTYLTGGSIVAKAGYEGGMVYYDNNLGAGGNTLYVNGTSSNPCNVWADAVAVAAALKTKIIHIGSSSTVTLNAAIDNYTLIGENWTLNLAGYSIAGAAITGANVLGVSTGQGANFYKCQIGSCTIDSAWFYDSPFTGTFTMLNNGNYWLSGCSDGIPGDTNPVFVFAASVLMGIRKWSGGININNLASGCYCVVDGNARVILDSNCTGGDIKYRGCMDVTDNVVGGFQGTVTETARFNIYNVWAALTASMTKVGSIGKKLADWVVGTIDTYTGNTKQTGDAFARLGAPSGASIDADIQAIYNIVKAAGTGDNAAMLTILQKFGFDASNYVNSHPKAMDTDVVTAAAVKADAVTKIQNGLATPTNITAGTITNVTNLTNAPTAGDFTAAMKTSLNAATPSVTVSDKTGFSLSAAGILAIWNQLTTDAGIVVSSFGKKLKDWALGTDNKALISTDAQDLSGTLDVNAKKLGGATPNNLAAGAKMDLIDAPNATAITAIQNGINWNEKVYFNDPAGVSGTTYPNGTASHPVNNIADAITIADNNKLKRIMVSGGFTALSGTLNDNKCFEGLSSENTDYISIAAPALTLTRCTFKHLALIADSGKYVHQSTIEECLISSSIMISSSIVRRSEISTLNIIAGGYSIVEACRFKPGGILQFSGVTAGTTDLDDCTGVLLIESMPAGSAVLNIRGFRGDITIHSSCVGGTINIFGGSGRVTNSTGGTTVNSYGFKQEDFTTTEKASITAAVPSVDQNQNGLATEVNATANKNAIISSMTEGSYLTTWVHTGAVSSGDGLTFNTAKKTFAEAAAMYTTNKLIGKIIVARGPGEDALPNIVIPDNVEVVAYGFGGYDAYINGNWVNANTPMVYMGVNSKLVGFRFAIGLAEGALNRMIAFSDSAVIDSCVLGAYVPPGAQPVGTFIDLNDANGAGGRIINCIAGAHGLVSHFVSGGGNVMVIERNSIHHFTDNYIDFSTAGYAQIRDNSCLGIPLGKYGIILQQNTGMSVEDNGYSGVGSFYYEIPNAGTDVNVIRNNGEFTIGLTQQQARDAMTLAPTMTPVRGSLDAKVEDIESIISEGFGKGIICYVAKDGSDSNDGRSFLTPYLTIAHAIAQYDNSGRGGTIFLRAGYYAENVNLPENVNIVGVAAAVSGGDADITGTGAGSVVLTLNRGCKAKNIRISNHSGSSTFTVLMNDNSALIECMSSDIAGDLAFIGTLADIQNCEIRGNHFTGSDLTQTVIGGTFSNALIADNVMYGFYGAFIKMNGGLDTIRDNHFTTTYNDQHMIASRTAGGLTDSQIYNNSYQGTALFATADVIANNTVQNNEQYATDPILSAAHGAGAWNGVGLTEQQVRDAMALATAATPAAGSIDDKLGTMHSDITGLNNISSADVQAATGAALVGYDSGHGVAKEASVLAIQNNTDFVTSIAEYYLIPASGYTVFKVKACLYDTDGHMKDPDSNELALSMHTVDNTNKNALLYKDAAVTTALDVSVTFANSVKLERESLGVYFCYVKIASTENPNQFMYDFNILEATVQRSFSRTNLVILAAPGTATLADNTTNAQIVAKALKSQDVSATTPVSGSVYKDIKDDVDAGFVAGAKDATVAKHSDITALNNISTSDVQTAAGAALTAYDSNRGVAKQYTLQLLPSATDIDALLTTNHGAGLWNALGISAQEVRDAMKLAPSAGTPAAGSIDSLFVGITRNSDIIDGAVDRVTSDKRVLSMASGRIIKSDNKTYHFRDQYDQNDLFILVDNRASRDRI